VDKVKHSESIILRIVYRVEIMIPNVLSLSVRYDITT
jgi:hypothetical protein